MPVIAVCSALPEAGKTTVSSELAFWLVRKRPVARDVVLVDTASEFEHSSTRIYTGEPSSSPGAGALYRGSVVDVRQAGRRARDIRHIPRRRDGRGRPHEFRYDRFLLVPASSTLPAVDFHLYEQGLDAGPRAFRDLVRGEEWVVVDCEPGLSPRTVVALASADIVLITVRCDVGPWATGLYYMMHACQRLATRYNPDLRMVQFVRTYHREPGVVSRDVDSFLAEHYGMYSDLPPVGPTAFGPARDGLLRYELIPDVARGGGNQYTRSTDDLFEALMSAWEDRCQQ